MSTLFVPVAEIRDVKPHPNADNLELAQILGWQVVVRKGDYQEGTRVVYFPPDTLMPVELSDRFGVTQYLSKQRIKATRLRGEPSFGLVMPIEDETWEIGQNVAEHYGVTKWEPPVRERRGNHPIANEHQVPRNPFFVEYTGIENLRHCPEVFHPDEYVVMTEKIHGTNSRIGMIEGEWVAGSHRVQRGPSDDLYWSPKPVVERLVEYLGRFHKQVIVYGEIFGSEIQSLDYGTEGYGGYRAFDILLDGRYLDVPTFQTVCELFAVPTVPVLESGPYLLERIKDLSKGSTTLVEKGHMREGVVVKPLIERHDPRHGRIIFKYVSDDYLLGKKTDFKEM